MSALVLAGGAVAMLALNLPGQMSYDSISQLWQGRTGHYNSWHPPVMAWLLGLFDALVPGPALFVLFDAILFLGAWGVILRLGSNSLQKRDNWRGAAIALVMVTTPQFLLYQGTVWKDVLFADAAIGGFVALAAFAAWRRKIWLLPFAILLVLAALTRQNGVLLLPAGAIGLGWIVIRRQGVRRGALFAGLLLPVPLLLTAGATLMLNLPRFGGDGGDGANAEVRVAQIYDLSGALRIAPGLPLSRMDARDPVLAQLLRSDGARFYSPAGAGGLARSPALTEAAADAPDGVIFAQWRDLVLAHPAIYLKERWPAFFWVVATPVLRACSPIFAGVEGEPGLMKALGLGPRIRPQDHLLRDYAGFFIGTPVLSHLTFLVLALILLAALLVRRRDPDIAMAAMLAGALVFTASFFLISLSCDYRYLDFLDLSALTAAFYWAVCPYGQSRYKN